MRQACGALTMERSVFGVGAGARIRIAKTGPFAAVARYRPTAVSVSAACYNGPAVPIHTLGPAHGCFTPRPVEVRQRGSPTCGTHDGAAEPFDPRERYYSEAELRGESWKPPSPLSPFLTPRNLLPAGVILATVTGLLLPQTFQEFPVKGFVPAMAFLGFVVGLDINLRSITRVFSRMQDVLLGLLLQWTVLPATAMLLAKFMAPALGMPVEIGTGLQLAACVPGAILSNYAVWVAQPQMTGLAIVLSTLSMLTGILLTPELVRLLLGKAIVVDQTGMLVATGQLIIGPVVAGMALNAMLPRLVQKLKPAFSLLALVDVCSCVGVSSGVNSGLLSSQWGMLSALLVLTLHGVGFFVSYFIARRLLHSPARAKCISIGTGMQSALLACFLSNKFFSGQAVTLPCSLSVTVMLLTGLGLAQLWRRS